MKDIFTTIFYIIVTIGVFVLTYYATKFLAKRVGAIAKTKNMQIMERIALGKEKQIAILRVGDEYFLVGTTGNTIQIGSPLKDETVASLNYSEADLTDSPTFSKTLENIMRKTDKSSGGDIQKFKGILSAYPIAFIIQKLSNFIRLVISKMKGKENDL